MALTISVGETHLTVNEFAKKEKVTPRTIRKAITENKISALWFNGYWMIPISQTIKKYISRKFK